MHNYGDTISTLFENGITQGNLNAFLSPIFLFKSHLSVHQDVLDYFQENTIDVILSSIGVLSSTLIADKFNIPFIFNSYQLGFIVHENCTACKYKGTLSIVSPYASLSPSLPAVLIDKLFICLMTLATHSLTETYDSQRRLLGLEEISPRNAFSYNYARFPIAYQTYHPLIPPSIQLPYGRWLVGYISPDNKTNHLSEEFVHFLRQSPSHLVVYVSFGTVVRINTQQLYALYEQFTSQNAYKVIWSLPKDQQFKLMEKLGINDQKLFLNDLPKHIKLVEYAPQKALLMAKEVEIFLSHGGYSSVAESILSKTPLLLFPLMGDQFYNSNVMVEIGCAVQFNEMDTAHRNILSLFSNIQVHKDCMNNAEQLMSRAGGAPEVAQVLEQLSSQGYEGMSFEYYTKNVIGIYSASLILVSILSFIIAASIWLCYCCGRIVKAARKVKNE